MNCDIKPEDLSQEFMNLEEFFAATTGVMLPDPVQSPYIDPDISALCEIPNSILDSTKGQGSLQGQHIVNDNTPSLQEVPHMDESYFEQQVHFNDTRHRNGSNSSGETITSDSRSNGDTPICDTLRAPPEGGKDKRYWDRRVKNNIAAKRSRDAKRMKETTVVKRWTFLEEENKRLKDEILNMQKRLNAISARENSIAMQ